MCKSKFHILHYSLYLVFKLMVENYLVFVELLLFSAELKPRGYYLELFWQADLGYIGQVIIGVKVPNSSHVASIQH